MRERPRGAVVWWVFVGWFDAFLLLLSLALALVFVGPLVIDAYGWRPQKAAGFLGPYVPNDALTRGRLLAARWVEPGNYDRNGYQGAGPETVAVGPDGYLYTGLCDAGVGGTLTEPPRCLDEGEAQGWVVRINPKDPHDVTPWVRTGGRPLGLAFDAAGRLYIADGEKGLLRVDNHLGDSGVSDDNGDATDGRVPGSEEGTELLEPSSEELGKSESFRSVVKVATCSRDQREAVRLPDYTDSVAVAPDGTVYFSCPSQRWPLKEIRKEILENRPTGRLLRYEPCDGRPLDCEKKLVLDNLMFANGIAIEPGGDSLLLAEWSGFRVLRLHLDHRGDLEQREVFFDNAPGYPDNLTLDSDGTLWVGLSLARQELIDRFRPYPFIMNALARLPAMEIKRLAWVLGIDKQGRLLWNLQDQTGFFNQATGAYPLGDALYIGSYTDQNLLCITHPGRHPEQDPCDPWASHRAKRQAERPETERPGTEAPEDERLETELQARAGGPAEPSPVVQINGVAPGVAGEAR